MRDMTGGLYPFLVDVVLALVTMAVVVGLLWAWFLWLAERAGVVEAPRRERPPPTDRDPPAPSASARAEIAELEALWSLPPHRGS
jgi:hypothetical protein